MNRHTVHGPSHVPNMHFQVQCFYVNPMSANAMENMVYVNHYENVLQHGRDLVKGVVARISSGLTWNRPHLRAFMHQTPI